MGLGVLPDRKLEHVPGEYTTPFPKLLLDLYLHHFAHHQYPQEPHLCWSRRPNFPSKVNLIPTERRTRRAQSSWYRNRVTIQTTPWYAAAHEPTCRPFPTSRKLTRHHRIGRYGDATSFWPFFPWCPSSLLRPLLSWQPSL